MRVDINHYLDTLKKKPGALRNSAALKSVPKLRAIFETHYAKQPKKFIEIFLENRELPIDEILKLFEEKASHKAEISALDIVMPIAPADVVARMNFAWFTQNSKVIVNYGTLVNRGVK